MSRIWKSTDPYPEGATFGELLDWHLWWGTRPGCSKTSKNLRWPFVDFAQLIHLGLPATGNPDTPAAKLRLWRSGKHRPEQDAVIQRIFAELFGDDPELADWKLKLWQALDREQKAKGRFKASACSTTSPSQQRVTPKVCKVGIRTTIDVGLPSKRPIWTAKAIVSNRRGLDIRELLKILEYCGNFKSRFYLTNLTVNPDYTVEIDDDILDVWSVQAEYKHTVVVQGIGRDALYGVEGLAKFIESLT